MAFDPVWEDIHKEREWGRYPKEELVRFVARNYYGATDRAKVRFLDLGCGAGASSWFLEREGFSVWAVDGSAAAVRRTVALAPVVGFVCDATSLQFEDEYLDCVVDIVCIAHNTIDDARKIVAEVHRVLKPGGRLFSMLPMDTCIREPFAGKGAVIFPTLSEVRALFDRFDIAIGSSFFSRDLFSRSLKDKAITHWVVEAIKVREAA